MTYLYRRGPGSKRRVMHLAVHDRATGHATFTAWCGSSGPFNTTINVPLGGPVCKRCAAEVGGGRR